MSTDLVQIDTNNALANQQDVDSWGEDDPIKPEYIVLKQPSSETLESFTNGHFVYKTIGKSWATMNLIPLRITKGRRKQTPYKEGVKSQLLCRSINRKTPVVGDERFTPLAKDCTTCPFGDSAWDGYDKETKTGTKPSCDKEVEMIFIEQESGLPFIFVARGKSVKPVEAMFDAIKAQSKDVQGRNEILNKLPRGTGRRPQVFEYVVTMTSERDGKNYVPKFTKVASVPKDQVESFGALYEQFIVSRERQLTAQAQNRSVNAQLDAPEESSEPETVSAVVPEYLPPPSRRVVGTRPTYVPPTEDNTPATEI